MKRMTGLITCLALSALSLQAGVRDGNVEWQNEKVVERGKEKPHAWFLLPERMVLNGKGQVTGKCPDKYGAVRVHH